MKKYIKLPNGIPSHDTFSRVFSLIKPVDLEDCFINWVNEQRNKNVSDVISIDGKISKGTLHYENLSKKNILCLVSAYSTESGLVLGQAKASTTGLAEVPAAMSLLDKIEIKGDTIVCDAGIGTSLFLSKVVAKGANYVCPIMKNQKVIYSNIHEHFLKIKKHQSLKKIKTIDEVQGRKEYRTYYFQKELSVVKEINFNQKKEEMIMPNLKVFGKVEYVKKSLERRPLIQEGVKGEKNHSTYRQPTKKYRIEKWSRYFISNLEIPIEKIAQALRKQWKIENKLHWHLDVAMGEDSNRTKNRKAAQNLSTIRKIGLTLAKRDKSKTSLKGKLKQAGWSNEYLEKLLFNESF